MRTGFERMARPGPALVLLGTLAVAGCGSPPPPETAPTPAVGAETTASFTSAQVERGRELFAAMCGECHSLGEFRGQTFQFTWRRRTAWDFFRAVSTTMPESAPGSLSDEEYVQIVAMVLSMNGFTPGSEDLEATEAALDRFVMDAGPGGR